MSLADFAVLSFASIFAIVDPFAVLPAFFAMTGKNSPEEKIRMAKIASCITCVVLVVFFIAGRWVLKIFGVSIAAFEIGGGIVLLKIAIDMLQAKRTAMKETPEEQAEGVTKEDIAVTPLAVPMLAGPGAITAVILLNGQAVSLAFGVVAIVNIFIVSLLTFFILRIASLRSSLMSGITMRIIERLIGLLLAAFAAQFVINGVRDVMKMQ